MRLTHGHHDVAVIGGGVIGCAVLRGLALAGIDACLLERGSDILSGAASKGNSAILHTGFDAPEDSLEHRLVRAGYDAYLAVHDRLNLPLLQTGAVLVAWSDEQAARLPAIVEKAHRNGVTDVDLATAEDVYLREPALGPGVVAGVVVPGEHVIDPWSAPLAYAQQALANGARARFDCEVVAAERHGDRWTLQTTTGPITADAIVNCAGLFGDVVDDLAELRTFTIAPRKGQFVVLDKSASALVSSIVLPVPTERSKGVLIAPTVFGNLLIGPTAEDVTEREHPAVERLALRGLLDEAAAKLPGVRTHDVTAVFAGLRPATEHRDYRLRVHAEQRWISVGGIRSTGLSASLGIAAWVVERLREDLGIAGVPVPDAAWPAVPNLAEHLPRDHTRPGHDGIACHCELVTRRELRAALEGPMPARSVGALKRRTRAMLGRCQGFYCAGEVAALTHARFRVGLAVDGLPAP